MTDAATIKRIDKRVDGVEDNANRLGVIIRGNGDGIGMRAEVRMNTDFRKEIRNYVRAAVLMIMAEGIAVIIWLVSQMPQ